MKRKKLFEIDNKSQKGVIHKFFGRHPTISISNDANLGMIIWFENFEFLVVTIIWFELLSYVNEISKNLHKKDMCIDVAIELVKCLIKYLKKYREYGFVNAKVSTEKTENKMENEWVFIQKLDKKPILEIVIYKVSFILMHSNTYLYSYVLSLCNA